MMFGYFQVYPVKIQIWKEIYLLSYVFSWACMSFLSVLHLISMILDFAIYSHKFQYEKSIDLLVDGL